MKPFFIGSFIVCLAAATVSGINQHLVCKQIEDVFNPEDGAAESGRSRRLQGPPGKTGSKGDRGIPGLIGPTGPRGTSAAVDYEKINATVEDKVHMEMEGVKEEMERRFNALTADVLAIGNRLNTGSVKTTLAEVESFSTPTAETTSISGHSCDEETCEDTTITSLEITASSVWGGGCGSKYISLESSGSWCPATDDGNQWAQWDFKRPVRIKGIVTQGNRHWDEWVKTYKVSYGNDTSHLQIYQTSAGEMVFSGNYDRETRVENLLPLVVTARYFRILPQTWNGYINMRAGLLLICCE